MRRSKGLEGETVDLALMERRRAEVRDTLELVHERVHRAAALGADAPEYVDSLSSVLGALSGPLAIPHHDPYVAFPFALRSGGEAIWPPTFDWLLALFARGFVF